MSPSIAIAQRFSDLGDLAVTAWTLAACFGVVVALVLVFLRGRR